MNACQILYYSSDSRFNISMAQGRLPYGGGDGAECAIANTGGGRNLQMSLRGRNVLVGGAKLKFPCTCMVILE